MQDARMRKRIAFLSTVLIVLFALIAAFGWASRFFDLFGTGRLEPAFMGALVAAAGAIFAACIAYTAASQNLEMASRTAEENAKQRLETEKQQRDFRQRQAATELSQLREALAFIDRYSRDFDGASEVGPRDYAAFYNDVYQAGGITPFQGMVPEPLRPRVHHEFTRFLALQNPFNMLVHRLADPGAADQRLALSRNIRERLAELRRLRGEIDEEIRRRERDIDAMSRQQS